VGANIYLSQRTVILRFAVMRTLGNGAADAFVCVHDFHLAFYGFIHIICFEPEFIPAFFIIKNNVP